MPVACIRKNVRQNLLQQRQKPSPFSNKGVLFIELMLIKKTQNI